MMLVLFVNKKEVSHDYRGGGDHVLFAKYNFYLSYIFINFFLLSYITFVKIGLTPCTIPSYSDFIFFKTFFIVSKPKTTNSRVSDCYLTPTQQFSAIS